MANHSMTNTWHAPKSAKVQDYLSQLAFKHSVAIHTTVDRGLIFESGQVIIRGLRQNCENFMNEFVRGIENYNNR